MRIGASVEASRKLWATFPPDIQVDVICFDNAGNPKQHTFFSTFTNRA